MLFVPPNQALSSEHTINSSSPSSFVNRTGSSATSAMAPPSFCASRQRTSPTFGIIRNKHLAQPLRRSATSTQARSGRRRRLQIDLGVQRADLDPHVVLEAALPNLIFGYPIGSVFCMLTLDVTAVFFLAVYISPARLGLECECHQSQHE